MSKTRKVEENGEVMLRASNDVAPPGQADTTFRFAIVGWLSVKARAAGIFLLFAAQRPDKDVMPMQLRSQLGNRLILKVDNAATAEIAMGIKNSGAERLLGRGHMLAKTGDTSEPVFAQVPYIDIERTVPQLVRLIRVECGQPTEVSR